MRISQVLAAAVKKIPENYHNIPKRTIERHTQFVEERSPRLPQYTQKISRFRCRSKAYYDEWRPWEREFKQLNERASSVPEIFVEPIRDWPFYRGDRVEVIRGPEKGKQGIINYIVKERNWVFVEGLNIRRTRMGQSEDSVGFIVCKEDPFLVNLEVKLVDPTDLLPTDIEWRYDDDGNKVRVSTRTERIIPTPGLAYETIDYVDRSAYKEQPKDTPASEVEKVTFKPSVATFEMDICDQMGIKDDRVPYPMYWY